MLLLYTGKICILVFVNIHLSFPPQNPNKEAFSSKAKGLKERILWRRRGSKEVGGELAEEICGGENKEGGVHTI